MNTENIEARLCDYIEGQLDEAGRAEIEQHLQANPQHRQLLAELTQTRDLLRDLPRQSAPAEIIESLQSQLERSVLLQNNEEESANLVLHVRRLPQFAAIAAMLLLAVGLAAVIYYVLPPANVNQPEIASLPLPHVSDASMDIAAASATRMERAVVPPRPALDTVAGRADTTAEIFTLSQNLPPMSGPLVSFREFHDVFGGGSINIRQTSRQNRVFVVITTTDSRAANTDVTRYLASNAMQWQPLDQSMPAPAEMQQLVDALASRNRRQQVGLKPGRLPAPADARREQSHEVQAMIPAPQAKENRDAIGMMPPAASTPGSAFLKGTVRVEQPVEAAESDDVRVAESAAPKENKQLSQQLQVAAIEPENLEPVFRQTPDFDLNAKSELQTPPAGEQVIVVRNITKRQAAQLSDAVSNSRHGQRAEMIDEDAARAGALPHYAGMTPVGDSEIFALGGAAPTAGPTSRPSHDNPAMVRAAPANESSTQPAVTTSPSTQSLDAENEHAAVAPHEDQPVDVVIVVQEVPAGAIGSVPAGLPPATQPSDLHLQPVPMP